MQEMLFNPAIWLPLAAAAVAIAVFVYGNNRARPALRNAALGALGLVIAWAATAYVVRTPIEQCVARTHAILDAAEAGDWPTFTRLLDTNTNLEVLRGNAAIGAAAESAAGAYGLKEIRTLSTDAVPGIGAIDVTVTTLLEGQRPTTATFRFEYEPRSDGILLARVVPVKIGELDSERLRRVIR